MKLWKHLAVVALLSTTPAWAQSYFQGWNVPDAESGNPVTGGNIFGADVISRGILGNGMYIMVNDTAPTDNFFVDGYFQRFDVSGFGGGETGGGLRNFTGMGLSLDVVQIPVGGITNPPPAGSFFFFELAFDKNGDGKYTDGIDNTYRTNLSANPFTLPGTSGTTFNVNLTAANFSVAGDVSGAFDLTKVSRVGFGMLQNVPDGGLANFPDGVNLGWKFDNLSVAAIPEPSSWAMTLVGLAGLAGILRRRK
jgi:PEP-CTERM motif-containing protein